MYSKNLIAMGHYACYTMPATLCMLKKYDQQQAYFNYRKSNVNQSFKPCPIGVLLF